MPVIRADEQEAARERMHSVTTKWQEHGFDLDFSELTFLGERADASAYLAERGWQVEAVRANDLIVAAGLTPVEDDQVGFGDVHYITALR